MNLLYFLKTKQNKTNSKQNKKQANNNLQKMVQERQGRHRPKKFSHEKYLNLGSIEEEELLEKTPSQIVWEESRSYWVEKIFTPTSRKWVELKDSKSLY